MIISELHYLADSLDEVLAFPRIAQRDVTSSEPAEKYASFMSRIISTFTHERLLEPAACCGKLSDQQPEPQVD
ncbi:MAG TPA: hypothetical protein VF043_24810 [Ktedonobacteraceae bacterium]